MKNKIFITTNKQHDPYIYKRISGWRDRQTICNPTSRHGLYDYRTDENGYKPTDEKFDPANGTFADGYLFQRKWWAVERFGLLSNPFWFQGYCEELYNPSGERVLLHAVDMDGNMFHPLYIELSPDCERARFYERVK